jgi:hypothetical protein
MVRSWSGDFEGVEIEGAAEGDCGAEGLTRGEEIVGRARLEREDGGPELEPAELLRGDGEGDRVIW